MVIVLLLDVWVTGFVCEWSDGSFDGWMVNILVSVWVHDWVVNDWMDGYLVVCFGVC